MSMYHLLEYPVTFSSHSADLTLFRHMLATPLTTLQLSFSDSQVSKSSLTTAKQLANIAHSLERIQTIFNFFADQNKVSLQTFSVGELAQRLQQYFPRSSHTVSIQLADSTLTHQAVYGNLFLLEEAVVCLIKNGLEAYQGKSSKYVSVTFWKNSQTLYISIKDFGIGMSWWQKVVCRISHISFKKANSGIGLPFCNTVIKNLYNGNLIINSNTNLGTEVICLIPLAPSTYTQIHE